MLVTYERNDLWFLLELLSADTKVLAVNCSAESHQQFRELEVR